MVPRIGVYLVEDSEIISKLLQRLLEVDGVTVVGQADSARTAIAEIPRVKPDIVIVDVALRQGNGFDVLKALSGDAYAERPVLFVLTNYTLESYRSAAKRFGADRFFDKSSEIPELLGVVRSIYREANESHCKIA